MSFVPRKGAVRTYECKRCKDVVTETWHGSGPADYRVDGPDGNAVLGCRQHPTHPGRGACDVAITEVGR